MRKCSLYIISSVLLLSCKTQKVLPDSFVSVYKSNRIGNIYPEYIILKSKPKTFEKFSPGLDYGVIGVWEASNDTIFLLPKYQYSQRENVCNFSELTNDDLSLATIPQKYMIKDNTFRMMYFFSSLASQSRYLSDFAQSRARIIIGIAELKVNTLPS
jgi:hypothetical protein